MFKIAIFGHETWQVGNVKELAYILSFYPRGVEIELICALRAVVSEIQAIFLKIAIFGHKTWSPTKDPEVGYTCVLFCHPVVGNELIFALRAAVSTVADTGLVLLFSGISNVLFNSIQFNSIQFIYSNQIIHVMMTFKKIDI